MKPGCDEHYLAPILRKHPDFIPQLDFVAEVEGLEGTGKGLARKHEAFVGSRSLAK